ncbi:amino acid ABC transporter permease [Nocardioides sp. GY 10127]|uniref:amino acid ABC transporter permease n=1 Tax=Nocardioides sp. GY 10127 TaxID=2569762 RepID=UPI0010A8FB24|nr:amino acid ABC transporter permease [Nocardioides sp. GY 10127]TIC85637.1 amino acid ABC transporter permease [Nocardioides sp. GY 10127]
MDFSLLPEAMLLTVEITLAAMGIGMVLGVLVVVARRSRFRVLRAVAVVWTDVVRGVPPLVWLMLVFLGIGLFTALGTAIIVFGLVASAYCAEIYRSGLEAVPRGQTEALAALAVPARTGQLRVVAPQAAVIAAPAVLSYAIGLVKDSSLASVIGVAELTFVANRAANRTGDGITPFVTVGVLYLLFSLLLAVAGKLGTQRLEGRWRTR